jgi:hypothetical protein
MKSAGDENDDDLHFSRGTPMKGNDRLRAAEASSPRFLPRGCSLRHDASPRPLLGLRGAPSRRRRARHRRPGADKCESLRAGERARRGGAELGLRGASALLFIGLEVAGNVVSPATEVEMRR